MAPDAANVAPYFSIIVPVLGEPPEIVRAMDARLTRALSSEAAEVVVVDGDPEGSTLAFLENKAFRQLLSPPGRARQMNAGAAGARGRALMFLHADTRLPDDGLAQARQALEEGAEAGAFALGIDSPRPSLRLIAAAASLRSRLTRIPYGDQAIFLDAGFFREIGGYADVPLMEDLDLMRRLKRRGADVRLLRSRVATSPRRWEAEGVLRCTLRNWLLASLFFLGAPPARLTAFYPRSRRPVRRVDAVRRGGTAPALVRPGQDRIFSDARPGPFSPDNPDESLCASAPNGPLLPGDEHGGFHAPARPASPLAARPASPLAGRSAFAERE